MSVRAFHLLRFGIALGLTCALNACTTDSPPITASTPASAQLAFKVQPRSAVAGVALNPDVVVIVEDPLGRLIPDATNVISLVVDTGPAAFYGIASDTALNGVATFRNVSLQRAGEYALTAVSESLASARSDSFAIVAAAPSQLLFAAQPSFTLRMQPITPAVQVRIQDAFGNSALSSTLPVTLTLATNPGGATLSGTATVNAVSGVATFANLSVDNVGAGYTLAATANSLTGSMSAPFDISGPPLSFASISAGYEHVCGVTATGAAYCWGLNNVGQLGSGTKAAPNTCQGAPCSEVPVGVSGGLTFTEVSAGSYYTCGVSAHTAYCWGSGPPTTNSATPVAVPGGLAFISVSAGYAHACGVTSTGAAYCWGSNSAGQLGNGTTTDSTTPVAVSGGLAFAAVSAGGSGLGDGYTCGLTTSGAVYCWGDNSVGELGNGTTTSSTVPVLVSGGLTFASVSAGGGPHTCGVTSTGAAYCWGDNSVGELGNGTSTNSTVPVPVSGGFTFTAVDARNGHSCGVASAGTAYCWGYDAQGQLGNGTYGPGLCSGPGGSVACSRTPFAVSGGLTFATLSAGWFHSCGVSKTGTGYCWGYNGYGDLGSSTPTLGGRPYPGPVLGP